MKDIHAFEVQLLGWAKSTSRKGPVVTFQFLDDEALSFFEELTVAKGKTAGQILDMAVSISSQDDQSDIKAPDKKASHKQTLSQYAAYLCTLDTFQRFVGEILKLDFVTEDMVKEYIYTACEIGSRAALTTNKGAEARFHTLIRNPYNEWFSKHANPKDTVIPE